MLMITMHEVDDGDDDDDEDEHDDYDFDDDDDDEGDEDAGDNGGCAAAGDLERRDGGAGIQPYSCCP